MFSREQWNDLKQGIKTLNIAITILMRVQSDKSQIDKLIENLRETKDKLIVWDKYIEDILDGKEGEVTLSKAGEKKMKAALDDIKHGRIEPV